MPSSCITHLDEQNSPNMVNIGGKKITERIALAQTTIELPKEVARNLDADGSQTPKGSIFDIAVIAGMQAAKKTADLIPLCHVIPLDSVRIDLRREGNHIVVECQAKATHKTGVEMEALIGASVAALTVYDMCKALSHDIVISKTKLIEKTGGKSDFRRDETET